VNQAKNYKYKLTYNLYEYKMVKVKKDCVLVRPEDLIPSTPDFKIIGTFNPGATRLPNGEIVLYVRVWEILKKTEDEKYCYSPRMCGSNKYKIIIDKFEKKNILNNSEYDIQFKDGTKRLTFISHFRRVILDKSGLNVKHIDQKPSFFGLLWDGELGVEDPRITKIGDLYVMTYVSLSRIENVSTSYAISNDCKNWFRRGVIFSEQNKDVVIFPELIDNEYVAIERPEGSFEFSPPHMVLSFSKDMQLWGRPHSLVISKKGDWDSGKVGAGAPPIKTDKGWLLIYHGIITSKRKNVIEKLIHKMELTDFISGDITIKDTIYCAGAALFDINDPRKLIAKSKVPILFPFKRHEIAEFGNLRVIFPTGLLMDENMEDILIFAGAGDKVTTVKKIGLDKIFNKLESVKI
jgi:beta-1,2-mannobiose phosphorylase / 1,2-beta-oligomannan phosphorylase